MLSLSNLSFQKLSAEEQRAHQVLEEAEARIDQLTYTKDYKFYHYKTSRGYTRWLEQQYWPQLKRMEYEVSRAYAYIVQVEAMLQGKRKELRIVPNPTEKNSRKTNIVRERVA